VCFTHSFWPLLVSGVYNGAIYALIALGYTLVYGVLQLINFAHSEVFMSGSFGGLFVLQAVVTGGRPPSAVESIGYVALGIVSGAVVGAAAAWILERVAYRPLRRRGAPPLAFLISAIGASFFALNLAGKEFGHNSISMPQLYNEHKVFSIFGAPVLNTYVIIVVVAAVMYLILDRIIGGTRLGQGIRAVAQDAETASLMGVDIDKIIVATFVLGGIMGGAGGFLYGMAYNTSFNMGFFPGLKAFTAAVLGGIGNIRGAVVGGLLLGIIESLGVSCIQTSWSNTISFCVLVLVLMFRPTGLFGENLGRAA
jgi:branched-chain amino acid transport system permease protein